MMDIIKSILHDTKIGWAIAGLVGAFVSMPFQSDIDSRKGKLVFLFSGAAYSYYLTGMAVNYFNMPIADAGSIGFLLGAFGGSLTAAIFRAIDKADLWGLLLRRFGR